MDLSPIKREILEALLLHEKPEKAATIAVENGKERPTTQMHLIGLVRMGYADSPQKGFYKISENGKKALGLPEINREKAVAILSQSPPDKAFHFYGEIGKPLNLYAQNLLDFCDKIAKVSGDSIRFHTNRGDFEAWFNALGDGELSKKMALIKNRELPIEELRERIRVTTQYRCMELSGIAGQPSSFP